MVSFTLEVLAQTGLTEQLPKTMKLPEKNTFIHFDDTDNELEEVDRPPRKATCPERALRHAFRTKTSLRRVQQQKLALHEAGECKPCCFFAFKTDGCRHGDDCLYCHFCTRKDIRRWKKDRKNKQTSGSCADSKATSSNYSGGATMSEEEEQQLQEFDCSQQTV